MKEEQDGIVLSPQRGTFSTGCQVSKTSLLSGLGGGRDRDNGGGGRGPSIYRQSSLTDYKDRDERDRDRRDNRRIGSGRIQIDRDQGREREQDYHRYDREDRDPRDRRDRMDRDRDRDPMDRDRNRLDRERDPRERRGYVERTTDRVFRRGKDVADKMAEHVSLH